MLRKIAKSVVTVLPGVSTKGKYGLHLTVWKLVTHTIKVAHVMPRKDERLFFTVDCETDPFLHGRVPVPFLWGLYTGVSYHEFTSIPALVDYIKNIPVIVYAHNGGKFDFHYLLNHINLIEKITVINGRLVVAHIGQCEIRDSWNILPTKLKDFGDKRDIDIWKLEADVRQQHMSEIRAYCKQDCVGLWDAIKSFEERFGRHLTLAGAAMHQWESISGKKRPNSTKEYFHHFSPYYYGGRVQCFRKGHLTGPYKVVDINSAYPRAMLEEHPYGTEYINLSKPSDFSPTSFVKVSCVSNGALPYRNEQGGMYFPDDNQQREYTCTGWELQAGLDTGTISRVKVLDAIEHTYKKDFSPYILHFYEDRLKAKRLKQIARDVFDKLMMTNLYGKFAANPENYGNFICVPFVDMEKYIMTDLSPEGLPKGEYEFAGMIGDHALLRSNLDEWQAHYLNVATAASITGYVRAKLWRAIVNSGGVAYCDTDSIIAQEPAVELGEGLGMWKDEGTASDLWIAGKKMYLCDGILDKNGDPKMATKGVRLTPEQIRRVAMGETITALNDPPTFSVLRKPVFQERRIRMTG